MKKKKKRIIVIVVLVLLLAAATVGVLALKKHNSKAYVELVSDGNMTWVLSQGTSSGVLTQSAVQNVYLEETQQVSQVLVSSGQQVTAGTPLFSYDTQLLELEVKQRQLEVDSGQGSLDIARQQLTAYQNITPISGRVEQTPPAPFVPADYQRLPAPYQGDGSYEEPLTYLCTADTLLSGAQIDQWIEEGQVAVLELREGDRTEGELLSAWTVDGRNFLAVAEDSWWQAADQ